MTGFVLGFVTGLLVRTAASYVSALMAGERALRSLRRLGVPVGWHGRLDPTAPCSGMGASFCPRCGRCTCERLGDDEMCPLHGDDTTHALHQDTTERPPLELAEPDRRIVVERAGIEGPDTR